MRVFRFEKERRRVRNIYLTCGGQSISIYIERRFVNIRFETVQDGLHTVCTDTGKKENGYYGKKSIGCGFGRYAQHR